MSRHLTVDQLVDALTLRDLSNPNQGAHAMQLLLDEIQHAIETLYDCELQRLSGHPLVRIEDNYDALGYPEDGPARESRYSRYLSKRWMLRTQTSCLVPEWLSSWRDKTPRKLGLLCSGRVYRRDSIDRLHVGEPHQVDLWVLLPVSEVADLSKMLRDAIDTVMTAVLPDHPLRLEASSHPYTRDGLQLEALSERNQLVEVGECGRIDPGLLVRHGWDPEQVTGVAMGLGLDRILMLRKHLPDIRLLYNSDPRVVAQMQDLERWRPVSYQPVVVRDLSIAAEADMDSEVIGDRVREAIPEKLDWLEAVEIISETAGEDLPELAVDRLGLRPGQKNVLLRLTMRHPTRSIARDEANALRNRVYQVLHQGTVTVLAQ